MPEKLNLDTEEMLYKTWSEIALEMYRKWEAHVDMYYISIYDSQNNVISPFLLLQTKEYFFTIGLKII